MENSPNRQELLALTAEIVASFVGYNTAAVGDLPALIASVHESLSLVGRPEAAKAAEPLVPAVPIKKSITADYLVCLEDGRKFKTLKRHLRTRFNMTPEEYRRRWELPGDYPMVAPGYAERRSALAKSYGLGRKAKAPSAPEPAAAAEPEPKSRPLRAGGRRKVV